MPPSTSRPGAALLVLLAALAMVLLNGTSAQAASGGSLAGGQQLRAGQQLASGSYRLVMQHDGNVVVYAADGRVRWHAGTQGNPGARLVMQTDGNLVAYSASGRPLWHARTNGNAGARAVVQADGNLVVYRRDNRPLWHIGAEGAAAGLYAMRSGLAIGGCGAPEQLARSMASRRVLTHGGAGWHGQIVAVGKDSAELVTAWRNSPPHSSVAARPDWTRMAGGAARGGDGRLYGVLNFCR